MKPVTVLGHSALHPSSKRQIVLRGHGREQSNRRCGSVWFCSRSDDCSCRVRSLWTRLARVMHGAGRGFVGETNTKKSPG